METPLVENSVGPFLDEIRRDKREVILAPKAVEKCSRLVPDSVIIETEVPLSQVARVPSSGLIPVEDADFDKMLEIRRNAPEADKVLDWAVDQLYRSHFVQETKAAICGSVCSKPANHLDVVYKAADVFADCLDPDNLQMLRDFLFKTIN